MTCIIQETHKDNPKPFSEVFVHLNEYKSHILLAPIQLVMQNKAQKNIRLEGAGAI